MQRLKANVRVVRESMKPCASYGLAAAMAQAQAFTGNMKIMRRAINMLRYFTTCYASIAVQIGKIRLYSDQMMR